MHTHSGTHTNTTYNRFSHPDGDTHSYTHTQRERSSSFAFCIHTYHCPISPHFGHAGSPTTSLSAIEREREITARLFGLSTHKVSALSVSRCPSPLLYPPQRSVRRRAPAALRGHELIHAEHHHPGLQHRPGGPRHRLFTRRVCTNTSEKKKKKKKNAMALTRFFFFSSLATSLSHSLSLSFLPPSLVYICVCVMHMRLSLSYLTHCNGCAAPPAADARRLQRILMDVTTLGALWRVALWSRCVTQTCSILSLCVYAWVSVCVCVCVCERVYIYAKNPHDTCFRYRVCVCVCVCL